MPRVAIIGAGISGLTSIKWCLEENLEPVCFEKNNFIAGLWQYHEDRAYDSSARVWRGLKVNGCRGNHMYSDFPDFENYHNLFPTHNEYLAYHHRYADKHRLKDHIRLKHEVIKVEPETTGWTVTYQHGEENSEHFDFVIVASGRFSKPLHPKIEGLESFGGVYKHSNQYIHAQTEDIINQRVLVIGNMLTAGEIAAFMADHAKEVWLSTGRGFTVVSRITRTPYARPMEVDLFVRRQACGPDPLGETGDVLKHNADECLRNPEQYGVLSSSGAKVLTDGGVTISGQLAELLKQGRVTVKKHAVKVSGKVVEFDDGTNKEFDTIYAATGYDINTPFLSDDIIQGSCSKMELFKFTWPLTEKMIDRRDMAFIGLINGFTPMTLYELQARWAVLVFKGLVKLPANDVMKANCKQTREQLISLFGKDRGIAGEHIVSFMDYIAGQIGSLPRWWTYVLSDPYLAYILRYTNVYNSEYRLVGRKAWPKARETLIRCYEEVQSMSGRTNWPKLLAKLYHGLMVVGVGALGAFVAIQYKNRA